MRTPQKAAIVESPTDISKERFYNAFNYTSLGIALIAPDQHFLEVNLALSQILGLSAAELLQKNISEIIHVNDQDKINTVIEQLLANMLIYHQEEIRCCHQSGQLIWVLLTLSLVHDSNGAPLYFIFQVQDISDRKNAEDQIDFLMTHDPLTGLANRNLLEKGIQHLIELANAKNNNIAVILFNVDRFNLISNSFGSDIGDALLKSIALRLQTASDQFDIVARTTNTFALVTSRLPRNQVIESLLENIKQTLANPYICREHRLLITFSIGISFFPEHARNSRDLLKCTAIALQEATSMGGNTTQIFSKEMLSKTTSKLTLENALHEALEQKQFVTYYQPIVNLKTGRITGAEGLVRWQHTQKILQLPAEFIPLAEETGLIIPIGAQVLREACMQYQQWKKAGLLSDHFTFSVNLSTRQFADEQLLATLHEVIKATQIDPQVLILEVTEAALMQNIDKNTLLINELKKIGVKIAIDNFGTGYSSLNYVHHFKVNSLKIDGSFLTNLLTDHNSKTVTHALIALAHNLNLAVVAEKVETREQVDFLLQHGCDEIQGYYISPAVPADEFAELLKSNKDWIN